MNGRHAFLSTLRATCRLWDLNAVIDQGQGNLAVDPEEKFVTCVMTDRKLPAPPVNSGTFGELTVASVWILQAGNERS